MAPAQKSAIFLHFLTNPVFRLAKRNSQFRLGADLFVWPEGLGFFLKGTGCSLSKKELTMPTLGADLFVRPKGIFYEVCL